MTSVPRVALVAAAALSLAAVTTPALAGPTPSPLRVAAPTSVGGASGAYTYDATQLPEGAQLSVGVTYPASGKMIVTLHVKGALPLRDYGAHAHSAACGASSVEAGGHFQYIPFPSGSTSTDPVYANPSNEVWLDLETNAFGNGSAQSVVAWQPGVRRPMSVVIHAAHTATAPGTAGTAGTRLGCISVPF